MNKSDLIEVMAEQAGISKRQAKKALEAMLIEIENTLQQGDRVSINGFGSWIVTRRASRLGRHPQSGKTIKINAKQVIKFNPSRELSEIINDDDEHTGLRTRK